MLVIPYQRVPHALACLRDNDCTAWLPPALPCCAADDFDRMAG